MKYLLVLRTMLVVIAVLIVDPQSVLDYSGVGKGIQAVVSDVAARTDGITME
jgi:hypothetical protein